MWGGTKSREGEWLKLKRQQRKLMKGFRIGVKKHIQYSAWIQGAYSSWVSRSVIPPPTSSFLFIWFSWLGLGNISIYIWILLLALIFSFTHLVIISSYGWLFIINVIMLIFYKVPFFIVTVVLWYQYRVQYSQKYCDIWQIISLVNDLGWYPAFFQLSVLMIVMSDLWQMYSKVKYNLITVNYLNLQSN